MTPDDPRHGTPAGAMRHYHDSEPACAPCRKAKNRAHKLNKYLRDNGDHGWIPNQQVTQTIQPWLAMGFTATAIFRAAGCSQNYGGNAYHSGRRARRDTYQALTRITENDFRDTDWVYADLTRTRIYSLRTAGHSLKDMPIDDRGVWRDATYVTVATARAVRDHFAANEMRLGSNKNGAARARNQGHLPPLAWDDPRTLAWDQTDPQPLGRRHSYRPHYDNAELVDEATILRVLAGEHLPTNRAEKTEIVRRWIASGRSERSLCERMDWRAGRYITRDQEAS